MPSAMAGTVQLPNSETGSGETAVAQQMMSRDFVQRANEYVLFESSLPVSSPAFRAAIADTASRIEATGRVTEVHSPLDPRFANQATGHAALLQFQLTGSLSDEATRVVPVLAAVAR